MTGAWTPRGLLLTATVTVAVSPSQVKVIEHVPLALAQGSPLPEYVSKDPNGQGRGLATGADVNCPERQTEEAHARRPDISGMSSAFRIWAACRTACTSLGSAQKAATTSRVRRRSLVGLRWGLVRDLFTVDFRVHIGVDGPSVLAGRVEALEFQVAEAGCGDGGVPRAPSRDHGGGEGNKRMWAPDQVRPLLDCSVLPVCSVELLHQIEQASEHSWAIVPTIVLLQAGIQDTTSPPPLTPPSHTPYLGKGQPAASLVGSLFASAAFPPGVTALPLPRRGHSCDF